MTDREAFRRFIAALREARDAWRASFRATIERQGYAERTNPDGSRDTFTRSTRPGVAWQLTHWLPDGQPTGHMDVATVDEGADLMRPPPFLDPAVVCPPVPGT